MGSRLRNVVGGRARAVTLRRRGWKLNGVVAGALAFAVVLSACSSSSSGTSNAPPSPAGSSGSSGSVGGQTTGITSSSVTVGQVDDLSLPLPGLFKGAEDGTRAYFDYVNSQGGVDGRKLVLDARDSGFQAGQVASETTDIIEHDFAMVGGFSLVDSAEKLPIDAAHMPDVGFSLDTDLASDPYVYSPLPNPDNDEPLGLFKYLKQRFPTQVKHVGILWANATASTSEAESGFEAAMKQEGFDIVYTRGFGVTEDTFLSDVLAMKNDGVQMFFSSELPDNYAATLAKEMKEQNFDPINIEGAAYSDELVALGGSAVNNMYIEQVYPLYLGADVHTVPAVALFNHWMKVADKQANFEIESVYGWASAELFVQALREAGKDPTRSGVLAQLDKVTSFDADGLVPPNDPAQAVPGSCFLFAQIKNGQFVRVAPTPSTGFYCPSGGGYLARNGFKPEVRPSPGL